MITFVPCNIFERIWYSQFILIEMLHFSFWTIYFFIYPLTLCFILLEFFKMAGKFLQNDILLYLLPSQFQMQNAYLSFSFIFRRTYVMKYIDLYCLAICQWGLMLRKFLYMIKIMIKFLMTLLPKLEKHIPLPSGHCLYDFKHVTILFFFL